MALFVQIDHFRKTDQKPTVKNHLFSISWFRSFNRTSFQQQLKQSLYSKHTVVRVGFNRTSFQQQLKRLIFEVVLKTGRASIVHPFNNNWNFPTLAWEIRSHASIVHPFNNNWNRLESWMNSRWSCSFNRTSFQQQLKHSAFLKWAGFLPASIVHPFNNNWNLVTVLRKNARDVLQSYILSTTTETRRDRRKGSRVYKLQSYILSTTTETSITGIKRMPFQASIVHPFNNNWNWVWLWQWRCRLQLQSYILSTTTETVH